MKNLYKILLIGCLLVNQTFTMDNNNPTLNRPTMKQERSKDDLSLNQKNKTPETLEDTKRSWRERLFSTFSPKSTKEESETASNLNKRLQKNSQSSAPTTNQAQKNKNQAQAKLSRQGGNQHLDTKVNDDDNKDDENQQFSTPSTSPEHKSYPLQSPEDLTQKSLPSNTSYENLDTILKKLPSSSNNDGSESENKEYQESDDSVLDKSLHETQKIIKELEPQVIKEEKLSNEAQQKLEKGEDSDSDSENNILQKNEQNPLYGAANPRVEGVREIEAERKKTEDIHQAQSQQEQESRTSSDKQIQKRQAITKYIQPSTPRTPFSQSEDENNNTDQIKARQKELEELKNRHLVTDENKPGSPWGEFKSTPEDEQFIALKKVIKNKNTAPTGLPNDNVNLSDELRNFIESEDFDDIVSKTNFENGKKQKIINDKISILQNDEISKKDAHLLRQIMPTPRSTNPDYNQEIKQSEFWANFFKNFESLQSTHDTIFLEMPTVILGLFGYLTEHKKLPLYKQYHQELFAKQITPELKEQIEQAKSYREVDNIAEQILQLYKQHYLEQFAEQITSELKEQINQAKSYQEVDTIVARIKNKESKEQ